MRFALKIGDGGSMQNKLILRIAKVSFLFSLTSTMSMAQGTTSPVANQRPPAMSSRSSLRLLLQNNFINSTFMGASRALLKTGPDLRLSEQLDSDPILNMPSVVKTLDGIMEQGIKDANNTGLKSMRLLTMKTHPRAMTAFIEAAKKKGFTDKQIANAKVYIADGPMNAFTVSPFRDEIVIVLYKTLVRGTDDAQLKGTIEHELSHIIDQHVLRGIQTTAMVIQLANIFSKGGVLGDLDTVKLKNYEQFRDSIPSDKAYVRQFWDFIFNNLVTIDVQNNGATDDVYKQVMLSNRSAFIDGLDTIGNAFRQINDGTAPTLKDGMQNVIDTGRVNPALAKASVVNFLQAAIESLSMMPVPQDDLVYLNHMLSDLVKGGEIDDRGAQQFTQKMMELIANLSKSWEASADKGVVENPRRAATLFTEFMGTEEDRVQAGLVDRTGNPTVTRKQLREDILQEVIDQWIELVATNSPEQLAIELGRDPAQNHPYPLRRVVSMLLSERTIPTIGFRNEFLTHVIIYNQLAKQVAAADAQILKMNEALNSPEAKKASKNEIDDLQQEISQVQEFKKASIESQKILSGAIEKLIEDPALPRLDGLNVRLLDLIDFQLALRQEAQSSYEEALKNAGSKEEKAQIEDFIKNDASIFNSNLMMGIKEKLSQQKTSKTGNQGMLDRRLKEMDVLTRPASSKVEITQVREELQKDGKSLGRATRIAIDTSQISLKKSDTPSSGTGKDVIPESTTKIVYTKALGVSNGPVLSVSPLCVPAVLKLSR